jgi:hypothetical protein
MVVSRGGRREVEGGGEWSSQSLTGRTTGLTPTTSARALVYMGKLSTRKERATHAHGSISTSHSSAAAPKSYVSGPNRERSLRLCQGCLTWWCRFSRLPGWSDRPTMDDAAKCWPRSHSEWADKEQQRPSATTLDDPRLLRFSSNKDRELATPQSEAPEA